MAKSADAFRTISEVADWLGVQPHVLRFWESKFTQVKPVKRAGGRRYYRPADMLLLGGIRKLLHDDGLTIKGAQKVLREDGTAHVSSLSRPLDEENLADALPGTIIDATPNPPAPETPAPETSTPEPASAESRTQTSMFDRAQDAEPADTKSDDKTGTPSVDDVPPAPMAEDVEPEPEPVMPPTFLRRPLATKSEIVDAEVETPARDSAVTDPEAEAAPAANADETAPSSAAETDDVEAAQEELDAAASPEPLKPNIVDAPDPDFDALPAAPSALSLAFKYRVIPNAKRGALTPLVARLAAHRDQLAARAPHADGP